MNPLKSLLALLALGIAASSPLAAQDQPDPNNPPAEGRRGKGGKRGPGAQGRGQGMDPGARVEQMDRVLGLSPDQKVKISDIFAKAREDVRRSRGGDGDRKANRERMQQAMQATRDQVNTVLTDEQRTKIQARQQQGGGRQRGKGQRGGKRPGGGQGKRKKNA
jgi:Spy/CpxP family protein refolding chaperone